MPSPRANPSAPTSWTPVLVPFRQRTSDTAGRSLDLLGHAVNREYFKVRIPLHGNPHKNSTPGVYGRSSGASYLRATRKAVVFKYHVKSGLKDGREDAVRFVPYDGLVRGCRGVVVTKNARMDMERRGFEAMYARCETDIMSHAGQGVRSPAHEKRGYPMPLKRKRHAWYFPRGRFCSTLILQKMEFANDTCYSPGGNHDFRLLAY